MPLTNKAKRKAALAAPGKIVPVATTSASVTTDSTMAPDETGLAPINDMRWGLSSEGGTTVPEIGVDESTEAPEGSGNNYTQTMAALIDKNLSNLRMFESRRNSVGVVIIAWCIYMAVIMFIDNTRGKLDDWAGLQHFGTKAILPTILAVIILIVLIFVIRPAGAKEKKQIPSKR